MYCGRWMDRVLIIIIKLHERWLDRGRCRQIVWEVAYVNGTFVKLEGASLKCLSSGWATIYLYYKERRQLKTFLTQIRPVLPLMSDPPVTCFCKWIRWKDYEVPKNRDLESVFAKNELFFSPWLHLPALYTHFWTHLESPAQVQSQLRSVTSHRMSMEPRSSPPPWNIAMA
jgi:hypothetical protein